MLFHTHTVEVSPTAGTAKCFQNIVLPSLALFKLTNPASLGFDL